MSWAIEAIEKEALKRAFDQIRNTPSTFSYLGYNEDRIRTILLKVEYSLMLSPNMSIEEINKKLDENLK